MDFQILFDKDAAGPNFKSGWGFSFFIDGILFDTGEDGPGLINNLKEKKIAVSSIEAVVISHGHWDHTGGLPDILRIKKNMAVYGCFDFSRSFKEKVKNYGVKLIKVKEFLEIKPNVYTSGQVKGFYKSEKIAEQALIVRSKKGLIVGLGCSHPGIIKIIEKIKDIFPKENIHLAFGGFHLMDKETRELKLIAKELKNLKVQRIGPAHCTGYAAKQVLKEIYKGNYVTVKAGKTIRV